MKIKLLKPFQLFTAGEVVDFADKLAETLIVRKIAEKIQIKRGKNGNDKIRK